MVLIVEDINASQSVIEPGLKINGYEIKACNSATKALKIIAERGVRIVVIDRDISDMDSLELCSQVRRLDLKRYVYIIVTNNKGRKDLLEAFEAGADDFISKPYTKEELIIRLKAGMRMLELEGKVNKSRKELMKHSKEDPLTGIMNRRTFIDEAINELDRASRERKIVSTIMIDIDDLKNINSKYGNDAGDNILIETARRLQSSCRPYDKIGRYGSGKFLILLPNTRTKTAVKIAKRIQSEITKRTYYLKGEDVKVAASFGVSLLAPDIGQKDSQIDDLIKKTELALQKANKEGKGKVAVYAEA